MGLTGCSSSPPLFFSFVFNIRTWELLAEKKGSPLLLKTAATLLILLLETTIHYDFLSLCNRLAWSFWATSIDVVFESPSGMMDINAMVDTIERTKGIQFAKGFNPEIECIRLSFDPVIASYRPLIHYGVSIFCCANDV